MEKCTHGAQIALEKCKTTSEMDKNYTDVLANDDYNIDYAYVLTNDNLRVEGKRIYMPIYMLMFIQKSPAPSNQIFKFNLHNL